MILLLPFIPLAAAVACLFTPSRKKVLLKRIALFSCAFSFFITLYYFIRFSPGVSGFQFVHIFRWLPELGISYTVGFDGINLTLCLLHALVSVSGSFLACRTQERLKEYLFFYLILAGAIYGVFTSLDFFSLYLFYEMTLIPLYPMIGIWGSKNKEYGAMKLTIFITAGAVLALFGLLLLYQEMGAATFNLVYLIDDPHFFLSLSIQKLIAPFLLIGFGVIASLWPLHSWSPIGYAAAPTSVSMLHAGVLKKMGPYLMIRIALTFLPEGVKEWSNVLAILAAIGILYAGYAAMKQQDLKFMVGFSSVSHMGYVLLGIAAMTEVSVSGAVLLMFSHGVMAACAFAIIGTLYEQTHRRGVMDFGGLGKKVPFLAVAFIMAMLASLGLPGFSNFAGELLVFIGSWQKYTVIVACAVFGILITAIYLLRAVQHVCYGPVGARHASPLHDAQTLYERFPVALLIGALLLFGFWPQGLLRIIQPAAGAILK